MATNVSERARAPERLSTRGGGGFEPARVLNSEVFSLESDQHAYRPSARAACGRSVASYLGVRKLADQLTVVPPPTQEPARMTTAPSSEATTPCLADRREALRWVFLQDFSFSFGKKRWVAVLNDHDYFPPRHGWKPRRYRSFRPRPGAKWRRCFRLSRCGQQRKTRKNFPLLRQETRTRGTIIVEPPLQLLIVCGKPKSRRRFSLSEQASAREGQTRRSTQGGRPTEPNRKEKPPKTTTTTKNAHLPLVQVLVPFHFGEAREVLRVVESPFLEYCHLQPPRCKRSCGAPAPCSRPHNDDIDVKAWRERLGRRGAGISAGANVIAGTFAPGAPERPGRVWQG